MIKPKRQKLPKIPPGPPAPPPPPPTRAEVEGMFLSYLTSTVERLEEVCKEWQKRIDAKEPAKLVHDLEWSLTFFEAASKLAVYSSILDAYTAKGTEATFESLTEHATREALGKAQYIRQSSSPISNITSACTTVAWASVAGDLRNWGESVKRADAYYGAKPPEPCEECGRTVEHAPICSKE